jgi:hypothetical protein
MLPFLTSKRVREWAKVENELTMGTYNFDANDLLTVPTG